MQTPAVIEKPNTLPATTDTDAKIIAFMSMVERAARDPNVDIDKMERLLQWKEKEERRGAELAFKTALAAAQAKMKAIRADCENTEAHNSRYASHATMDGAVRDIYTAHGFSLTFDTADAPLPETVRVICDVSHEGGHTRQYHIDMPADGRGPKGNAVMNRIHATGSAITYGRRYLLGMVFNLAVTKDDDGNAAGGRKAALPPQLDNRPAMGPPTQALPPRHAIHRDTPRFQDLMASEFPSPNQTAYRPRQGPMSGGAEPDRPTEMIRKLARTAAGKGREAFRQFCPTVTRTEYAAGVQPILAELERIASDADLDIPAKLDRRRR